MDVTKGSASAAPIYEDFVPTSDLASDKDCDTILIHLPGFKKEQLRVQLTKGMLRISGSMPVGNNKMRRFQKEFPVSPNCDTNKITARFESGVLHVKQPKSITPETSVKKPAFESQATQNVSEEANDVKQGKETEKEKRTCCSKNENNMDKLSRNEEKTLATTDGGVNTRIESQSYRKMVGATGKRMKMQRRVMNIVFAGFFTCIVAIYVNNLISSFRQSKN